MAEPRTRSAPPDLEARFDAEVREHLPRNFLAHLGHGLLGQTGFRLIQAQTFVPAYVHLLSGSDLVVGMVQSVQSLGQALSPILGATTIEHRPRVLPTGFVVGAAMRLQLLGLALAGFFLGGTFRLIAIGAVLGLFGFFLGMQAVVFRFLISKVIPVERRGVLLGLRNALSGVTAAGVGLVGGVLIERNALGNGYAATFGLAFVLTSLGLAMLAFVREPRSPRVLESARVRQRVREIPALLRADPHFTAFFVARALGMMGRMATPFYVLYAGVRIGLSGHALGVLTAALVFAQSAANLLWGLIADRRGFRVVFLGSLAIWVAATLALMEAGSLPALVGVFFGLGAGTGGFLMASQNLVLEFGARENLPLRIAVANAAAQGVGAVGPLLGGVLAASQSYTTVFWTAIVFQAAAFALVARRVAEPRYRRGPA